MAIGTGWANIWSVIVLLVTYLFSGWIPGLDTGGAVTEQVVADVKQEAAAVDVDSAWELIDQAYLLWNAGNAEEAIPLFRQAGTAQDEQVQMICANALWQMDDFEGAAPIMRALIDSDAGYHYLRYYLAGALAGMGRVEEARAVMDEALAMHPEDEENVLSYAEAAYLYLEQEEAIRALDAVIRAHPEQPELYAVKAWLLTESWAYDQAMEATRQALAFAKALNYDLSWYYWQQYDVEKQMGDFDQALKTINRALGPGDELYNYLERVELRLWYQHNVPAALEELDALALKHENDPQVLYLRMIANLRLEQYGAAREDVAVMGLDDATEQLMKGICALYEDNVVQAVACLDAALEQEPDNVGALLYRAIAAIGLEDDAQGALELTERAIALAPDSADAYKLKGDAYRDLGLWTQAEETFRQAMELATDDPSCAASLVTLLVAWNRVDDARQVVERMDAQYPNWYATTGVHITIEWVDEAYADALETLKTYQARFVTLAESTQLMEAHLLAALNEREAALALYEADLESPSVSGHAAYAYGLMLLGDYEQAEQALEAGTQLLAEIQQAPALARSDERTLLVARAELCSLQGDVDGAMEWLEQACVLGYRPVEAFTDRELATVVETEAFQDLLARYPVE